MGESDYFELLSLPRQFDLDLDLLEKNYLALSRMRTPDFHGAGSPVEQTDSLRVASDLNGAYRTLKDSFKRAEYLLNVLGGPTAAEVKEMPQSFLVETMELRMALEELKAERNAAGLQNLERDLSQRQQAMLGKIGRLFENPADQLKAIRAKLNALKFIQGMLRDARED